MSFKLHQPYPPSGDQPEAIAQLVEGLERGDRYQTLLGVTGSGKTFTIANTIAQVNRPTLVLSHNKTLAAQLYGEFKQFFPDNAVGYFISYYDYFQPEAYVPQTNTYIAKDASINDDIDRLRLQATSMLLEREDVIIVSSVSCIYGLGAPEDWRGMRLDASAGARASRREILDKLVSIQYTRNDIEVGRGNFRVRGDVIEVHPAYEDVIVRIELDDDIVARISAVDPVSGQVKRRMAEGLSASTVSGRLVVKGVKTRTLELATVSGDLVLVNIACDRAQVRSVSGTMEFAGQLVKSFNGRGVGNVTVDWNAANVASGIYFYKATAGAFTDTKKMVLMK